MSLVSHEAEQSVIGACLLDGKVFARVADLLTVRDFDTLEHGIIWHAMKRLYGEGRPLDVVTISDRLEHDGTHESIGGLTYLTELARNTPSANNAKAYAETVADLSARRRMLNELGGIAKNAQDKNTPFLNVVDNAQGRLMRLVRADAEQAGPMSADLEDMVDEIDRKWNGEEQAMGLSFGLRDLDDKTMGMHPGNLVIVAGRPGMGKTAFALNVLRACCVRDNSPGLVFSMEMDRKSLRNRMAAAIGDMPLQAIRDPKNHMTDELWPKLSVSVAALKSAPLIVDDRAALSPAQMRGAAKRWRDHYGKLSVIMVDYMQLMGSDGKHNNREQEVAEFSRSLKQLGKDMGCPVIALSQLNRGLESRTDKRPRMADLRESGAIEQDADLILFLYRHEVYDENTLDQKGIVEIGIGKQREGELGTVFAQANLAHARFGDLDHNTVQRLANPPPQPTRKPKSAMAEI